MSQTRPGGSIAADPAGSPVQHACASRLLCGAELGGNTSPAAALPEGQDRAMTTSSTATGEAELRRTGRPLRRLPQPPRRRPVLGPVPPPAAWNWPPAPAPAPALVPVPGPEPLPDADAALICLAIADPEPALACSGCGALHRDPGAAAARSLFTELRASAYAAGWRTNRFAGWTCPACQARPDYWAPHPARLRGHDQATHHPGYPPCDGCTAHAEHLLVTSVAAAVTFLGVTPRQDGRWQAVLPVTPAPREPGKHRRVLIGVFPEPGVAARFYQAAMWAFAGGGWAWRPRRARGPA